MAPSTARPEIVQPVAQTAPSVSGLSTIESCQWVILASWRLPLLVMSAAAAEGSTRAINAGAAGGFHPRVRRRPHIDAEGSLNIEMPNHQHASERGQSTQEPD